jgi:RNA polymerase sigma-70 factor (ECF subfamily)
MSTLMNIQTKAPLNDDTALAKLACTDADAFAELYRRYVTGIYRYHMAHTGNIKDAEDLTSQTFMAALEGIRSYRGTGSFRAWIMGIASRKRAFFSRKNRHEAALETALHIPDQSLPTDKAAARRLQMEQVHLALRQITPDRAEALILCFFGGLKPAEAGLVLKKSEAAVKMLISRGLNDLRTRTSLALEVMYE